MVPALDRPLVADQDGRLEVQLGPPVLQQVDAERATNAERGEMLQELRSAPMMGRLKPRAAAAVCSVPMSNRLVVGPI